LMVGKLWSLFDGGQIMTHITCLPKPTAK